jgi:CO dehydrogenase/acetyl-CoA synthase gamma subunit (corrinoid Fe-S protein)
MNNEPVAWVVQSNNDGSIFSTIAPCGYATFEKEFAKLKDEAWVKNGIAKVVPLYTHPAKTLTMAEMEDFINAYGMDMGDRYEFTFAQLTKMIVEIEHQIKGEK